MTAITVESAAFDTQLLKNPDITGAAYQQGEELGFWNVREYVLFRDGHVCQHCRGKSKDPILNVHHIESRRTGGDAPNNLITLCETCHKAFHRGEIKLKVRRGKSFKAETFMGIMRRTLFERLKKAHPELNVRNTYGYLTKHKRCLLYTSQAKSRWPLEPEIFIGNDPTWAAFHESLNTATEGAYNNA